MRPTTRPTLGLVAVAALARELAVAQRHSGIAGRRLVPATESLRPAP